MLKPSKYHVTARHPVKRLYTKSFVVNAMCEWDAKNQAKSKAPFGWEITVEAA